MKTMIQIIDKMQSKQMPKAQKMRSKETSEFKDTLNQTVSGTQNAASQANQASSQTNQSQQTDNLKPESGQNTEEGITKEELDVDKNVVEGLALTVNAFQMQIKPEIKAVKIEMPKDLNSDLKVEMDNSAKIAEGKNLEIANLGKNAMENQLQSIAANDMTSKNNITENMLSKNQQPTGKIKLDNFEAEELVLEPVKNTEFKTGDSEIKLNAEVKSESEEAIPKISAESLDDGQKSSVETKLEKDTSLIEVQNQSKPNELEVIKVKVGDGQTISSEKLVTEVAKNVVIKTDRNNEYELQLDPENLGKIKVKLLFEDGKLTVTLLCNNGKTANLLSEGISNLGQVIQQSTKSEVTVNVREENYLNDNQQQQSKQNSQNQQQQNSQNKDETEFVDSMKLGLWEIENLKKQFSADFRIM